MCDLSIVLSACLGVSVIANAVQYIKNKSLKNRIEEIKREIKFYKIHIFADVDF